MPILTVDPVAISGATVTGTPASGQVPVASSASAAAWKYPPGFEINYTQITASANVTDTSEATATALISPGAITFDGTAVLLQFYCPSVFNPNTISTTDFVTVTLFEGAAQVTRLATVSLVDLGTGQQIQTPVSAAYRFTPTAAAHTYKVCAFTNSTTGTPKLLAGSGGTNGDPATFVRFSKV